MSGEFISSDGSLTPESEPISHKVVVSKWSDGDGSSSSKWTLLKSKDGEWTSCRRDTPEDETVFSIATQTRWLELPAGEYALSGEMLVTAE